MDTASFLLNLTQMKKLLADNKGEFDFTEIDESNVLYNPINKNVIGNMNRETSDSLV